MNWKLARKDDPDELARLQCALAAAWDAGREATVSDMEQRLNDLWAARPVQPPTENPFRSA